MLIIGIDPGTNTGVAVWCSEKRALETVSTWGIIDAMASVLLLSQLDACLLVFEDSRKRTWYGSKGRESLQGAGSIKRDCAIWQEFCKGYKIPYRAVKPARGLTKWNAEQFKRLTGWQGRTSEHARDAAMLVYQYREPKTK